MQFSSALQMYTEENKGYFPNGQSSPEASLSLLYRTESVSAEILRGKTVPRSVVEKILTMVALLGPETCGWHYVEGLNTSDDSRIAIIWDKVGLGHDGQNIDYHEVLFLDGDRQFIPKSRWDSFLAEQSELLAMSRISKRARPTRSEGDVDHFHKLSIVRHGYGLTRSNCLSARTSNWTSNPLFLAHLTSRQQSKDSLSCARGQTYTGGAYLYLDEVPKNGAWEMVIVVQDHYSWEVVVVFKNGEPDQPDISFEVNRK